MRGSPEGAARKEKPMKNGQARNWGTAADMMELLNVKDRPETDEELERLARETMRACYGMAMRDRQARAAAKHPELVQGTLS